MRAVGMCMSKNPDNTTVPCHRVVGSDGTLKSFAFGGRAAKMKLLKKERERFTDGKVDLSKFRWNPE